MKSLRRCIVLVGLVLVACDGSGGAKMASSTGDGGPSFDLAAGRHCPDRQRCGERGQPPDHCTDVNHCGGCGVVCSPSHMVTVVCEQGICAGTCAPGYADCNGNKQADGCETPLGDGGACPASADGGVDANSDL